MVPRRRCQLDHIFVIQTNSELYGTFTGMILLTIISDLDIASLILHFTLW